jgi:hypothetical protein
LVTSRFNGWLSGWQDSRLAIWLSAGRDEPCRAVISDIGLILICRAPTARRLLSVHEDPYDESPSVKSPSDESPSDESDGYHCLMPTAFPPIPTFLPSPFFYKKNSLFFLRIKKKPIFAV